MFSRNSSSILRTLFGGVLGGIFLLSTAQVPAQTVFQQLEGGGYIAGTIHAPGSAPAEANSPESKKTLTIGLASGGEITLQADLIKTQDTPNPDELVWRKTAPQIPDTVEEQSKMAQWCIERGLTEEARLHYERILELDTENEAAHKALGHVQLDGRWMTAQERKDQLGYESFGGRSVTSQEAALLRQKAEEKKNVSMWKKRLKALLPALREGTPESLEQLRQINDPSALAAITDLLRREENPQMRVLFVQAISTIGTPAAMGDLATIAVIDDDGDVRRTALERLADHPNAVPGAIRQFRHSLFHTDNAYINHAGAALGFLNAEEAIPDLINSLVTRHSRTVVEGADKPVASFTDSGFSFNPGGATSKEVIDTIENSDVLAALLSIAGSHYPQVPDFGYDIPAWKDWLAMQQELENFNIRRSY